MGVAEGIRKHGFRKWYERELLGSHGWLVLALLCTIGLFAAIEGLTRSPSLDARIGNLAAILVCAVVGVVALRRYLLGLGKAEALAKQAVCAGCQTYGRLEVCAEECGGEQLRVRCRHCRHEWTLHA